MGMGLLFGALSGAGEGIAKAAGDYQKFSDEQSLMQERAALEEQKALRLDEIKRARDRQAGVDQGNEIGSATAQMQNERDAAAINASQGSNMSAEDAQVLRNNPEARKAYGLLGATRQSDLEDRATAAEKLGFLDAAKETRGQLQNEITNQRNKSSDESTNRRMDLTEEYQRRREDRLDRLAEAQLSFQKSRASKEDARASQIDTREQRAATAKALDGVNADIRSLEKESADPTLLTQPEKASVVKRQMESLRSEASRYRSALAGAGLEGSTSAPAPSKPFNPSDFRLKTSAEAKPSSAPSRPNADTRPQVSSNDQPIDVSNDPVLSELRNSMTRIDPSDPGNADKIRAIGNARNDRMAQLQQKYGSMSKLTGY